MNKDKQIEQERYDMAKTMADNFHINGEKWDDSDFEWTAHCLQMEGYHKQSEGEWEIVKGSNGQEKMVCTNCRHGQDLHSTFTYCPNCGARMSGGQNE